MRAITYLGNKRKLLPQITTLIRPATRVLDLFSGSGIVSAHLKEQGIEVYANDIAQYSYHINVSHLECSEDSYPDLGKYLEHLNSLRVPKNPYFSLYYSENAEATFQRLYYTNENGRIIDSILEDVWNLEDSRLRSIILSDLLQKMTKHVNTSGHFKTWHKEWGGREKDNKILIKVRKANIRRILTPIEVQIPEFVKGPKGKSFCFEAKTFLENNQTRFDAIYIDPPYNGHQYSANYHLLEQACRPLAERYIPTNNQISGIQPDLFKSAFCSKKQVHKAFHQLLSLAVKHSDNIILSYNANGILSTVEMEAILKQFGAVTLCDIDYITFRGGMNRPMAKKPSNKIKEYLFHLTVD